MASQSESLGSQDSSRSETESLDETPTVSKHSFALQLWTRALLRVVLKGDRPSINPARR